MPHLKKYRGAAVFLDRDGTINEDVGYLSDPDGLVLIKGALPAIKALNEEGVKVIVISNQSGVSRGVFTVQDVSAVNKRLMEVISSGGASVDGIYYCPHKPEDNCACRKPKTGLIEKAAAEHSIAMRYSYVIGDKASDVELARNAGAKSVLVLTGHGAEEAKKLCAPPDYTAKDILDAVSWVLSDMKRGRL